MVTLKIITYSSNSLYYWYLFGRDKEHSILSLSSVNTLQLINQEADVPLKMLIFHLHQRKQRGYMYNNKINFKFTKLGTKMASWCGFRTLGSLTNDDNDSNENRKKRKGFRLAKQQLCFAHFFCTFLCRRCTAAMWKCLNLLFVKDGNTRQQLSFSFPELWYSPLEFNSKNICQHLTK